MSRTSHDSGNVPLLSTRVSHDPPAVHVPRVHEETGALEEMVRDVKTLKDLKSRLVRIVDKVVPTVLGGFGKFEARNEIMTKWYYPLENAIKARFGSHYPVSEQDAAAWLHMLKVIHSIEQSCRQEKITPKEFLERYSVDKVLAEMEISPVEPRQKRPNVFRNLVGKFSRSGGAASSAQSLEHSRRRILGRHLAIYGLASTGRSSNGGHYF